MSRSYGSLPSAARATSIRQLGQQALAQRGAVRRQPHAHRDPWGEQPLRGFAEQVHDFVALKDGHVDGLLDVGGQPRQVRAGDVGQLQAAEQRGDQARHLDTQAEPARRRFTVQPPALRQQCDQTVDGRHRHAQGIRDLLLRQLGRRRGEQLQYVQPASQSSYRTSNSRNLLSHTDRGYSTIRMSPRQSPAAQTEDTERTVRVVDNDWVPLPDGVRLAIRLWLPQDAEQRPVSAILDSVPYRKSDGTAVGDAAWGTYFASHGFAFARVDLRGSGDSDGLLEDEYSQQEQEDAEHVIAWLADRPWCTGAVGMIGVSWGGFAALQMAGRHPAQLRGVVPIHASEDRYADDVHYIGGCVSAMDMSQWATSMLAYLNQPPDPEVVGEAWRAAWLERLEGAISFIEPWLGHQRRDAYWKQGSPGEDYSSIRCPVYAVGGWSDGYRDMVLRLVEHVRAPVRGLIGPWGHTCPEAGRPGPAIGFLQECRRFFAASLDDEDNGFFDEPRLITYMQEAVPPAGSYPERPGRWVADPSWPSPAIEPLTRMVGGAGLNDATTAIRSISSPQFDRSPRRGVVRRRQPRRLWARPAPRRRRLDYAGTPSRSRSGSRSWAGRRPTGVERRQALGARGRRGVLRRRSRRGFHAGRARTAESQPARGS